MDRADEAEKRSAGSQQATRAEGRTGGEQEKLREGGGGGEGESELHRGEDEIEKIGLERTEMTAVTSPVEG